MSKPPVSYRIDPRELAERKAKRLADRHKLNTLHLQRNHAKTAKSDRARHRAIVFLTTLPTDKLLAVYRAALTHFKP
jgi:cation transport regulator ChaC